MKVDDAIDDLIQNGGKEHILQDDGSWKTKTIKMHDRKFMEFLRKGFKDLGFK